MSFESNSSSSYQSTSIPALQADGATAEESALVYFIGAYSELNQQNPYSVPLHTLDTDSFHYNEFQPSPSSSTSSTFTTPSISESPMLYLGSSVPTQPPLPSPIHKTCRPNSYPPMRSHSRPSRSLLPDPEPPVYHETFEVKTGEEEVFKACIHRLSDEQKRSLDCPPSSRPTFYCMFEGCGRFLLHRAQVKPHLADHGYRFQKPYKCSCGAEFGRQVEAARHVEDKKPCEKCQRSGRKYKGGSVCLRCLRHHPGN